MEEIIWKAKIVTSEEEVRWALFGLNFAVAIIEQQHPLEAGSPVSYQVFLSPTAFAHIMSRGLDLQIKPPNEALCLFMTGGLQGVLKKLKEIFGHTIELEHN